MIIGFRMRFTSDQLSLGIGMLNTRVRWRLESRFWLFVLGNTFVGIYCIY